MNQIEVAKRMMRRLCAFQSFRPDKNQAMGEAYIEAIGQMLRDFGSEATYDAITSAINAGGSFAPSAGDLRSFVGISERRKSSDLQHFCTSCAELKDLLLYYGDHPCHCPAPIGGECMCGWRQLLSRLVGKEEAAAIDSFGSELKPVDPESEEHPATETYFRLIADY